MSETVGPDAVDQNQNLMLAGLCILAASILFTIGGYRVGFEAVRSIGLYFPAALLEILSKFGETFSAVCLIALIARRRPQAVWMGVLAGAYATILTHALKHFCDTARPPAVFGNSVVVTGAVLKLHSFPSGHTMTAFLLVACFSVGAQRKTKLLLYALAATVGLSRVWIGAHWPIDVIAGASIAGLSVALSIRTMKLANRSPGPVPYLVFVLLIAVSAVLGLMTVSEYRVTRLLGIAIAALSLSVLARDYVFRPLWVQAGSTSNSVPEEQPSRAMGHR